MRGQGGRSKADALGVVSKDPDSDAGRGQRCSGHRPAIQHERGCVVAERHDTVLIRDTTPVEDKLALQAGREQGGRVAGADVSGVEPDRAVGQADRAGARLGDGREARERAGLVRTKRVVGVAAVAHANPLLAVPGSSGCRWQGCHQGRASRSHS